MPARASQLQVALLTGGKDPHYSYGLTAALAGQGVAVDFIGSDAVDVPALRRLPSVRFVNLRGNQRLDASLPEKVRRISVYYLRLMRYALVAEPKIFHILWNNKFQVLDATFLMLYYRLAGRRVAFTAHNVNAGRRDSNNTFANRVSLRIQYKLSDRIFVHTEKMKRELVDEFSVDEEKITVIPYGINNAVPDTALTSAEAKRNLGLCDRDRAILFFGRIAPYKGLDYLVSAFQQLVRDRAGYRLIIAGEVKEGAHDYWRTIHDRLREDIERGRVMVDIREIPDEKAECFFKAADVLVLPYREIFQSGVLFFGFSFGLPVIAADVGSLREDIIEGRTGFLCRPDDPDELANTIETYFESDLFSNLEARRHEIREIARRHHSWEVVGEMTRDAYRRLIRDLPQGTV